MKMALTSPPVLDFFDPRRRTVLETDAARSGGLGYCLLQQDAAGRWRLIQCGSRFLSDAESRYAVIELELLALAWACKKCSIYLGGMQRFEVLTDHRPLIPILNSKSLAEIENPRLQRLRERLAPFNLLAIWRQGKLHAIPDALSRAPVDDPAPEDEEAERDASHQLASVLSRLATDGADDGPSPFKDAALTEVRAAAAADPELIAVTDLILNGFPEHRSQLDPRLRPYWGVRDRLAVDDGLVVCGQRLVIPPSLRRATLERLHASHQGVERTKRRARQVVYWPFLDSDIANHVGACPACQQYLPSQQKEPLMPEKTPSRVLEAVSADYFAWAGRTFLVYADRLSGWPFVSHVAGEATARDLVCSLRQIFAATGVPTTLRTDGGHQFTARLTREFLRRWGVEHQISTPHYPQSNGHAESAVKAAKRLIQKATSSGELDTDAYAQGLLELRNTPRADGRSPAQVLFGHPLRSAVRRTTGPSPTAGSGRRTTVTPGPPRSNRKQPSGTTRQPASTARSPWVSVCSSKTRGRGCGTASASSRRSDSGATTWSGCPVAESTGGTSAICDPRDLSSRRAPPHLHPGAGSSSLRARHPTARRRPPPLRRRADSRHHRCCGTAPTTPAQCAVGRAAVAVRPD